MQLRNSVTRYGLTAITFHWLIAVLFILTIMLGLYMTSLSRTDPNIFTLFQRHKSLGFTILGLVILRALWRTWNVVPPMPQTLKPYEQFLAHLTHYGLYTILFLMPLTGWIVVSASKFNIPTVWFGLFTIPHLGFIADNPNKEAVGHLAGEIHEWLAWTGIALVCLHFAGAMKHYFIMKDEILQRMLPARALFRKDPEV